MPSHHRITALRIDSQRLILRPLSARNALMVLDYHQRNAAFFEPWLPAYGADFFTERFHKIWLERDLKEMRQAQKLRLFLFERSDEKMQRIIGDISFTNIIRGVLQSCFVGYKIDRNYQGQGLMTEALAHSIQYVFEQMNLHRIEAHIMPRNGASQAVAEKLGFQKEGLAEKYIKINGVWEDHIRYALINQNYG